MNMPSEYVVPPTDVYECPIPGIGVFFEGSRVTSSGESCWFAVHRLLSTVALALMVIGSLHAFTENENEASKSARAANTKATIPFWEDASKLRP
jgi:hypothetical protein